MFNRTILKIAQRNFVFIIILLVSVIFPKSVFAMKNTDIRPHPLIPLQNFFINPEITGYQISPDGTKFAFLKSYNNRMNIFVQDVGTNEVRRITDSTTRDIRQYSWKNDQTIIYAQDNNGDENYHIYTTNIQTGVARDITPFPDTRTKIINSLPDNEQEILIVSNQRNPTIFDVYRLNVITGDIIFEVENPGNFTDYKTDNQGVVRIAYGKDVITGNNLIYYRPTGDQAFKLILSTDYRDHVTVLRFDGANDKIYILSDLGRDRQALVVFNPEQVREECVLLENPYVDIAGAVISKQSNKLLYAYYLTDKFHYFYFDKESQRISEFLKRHFGSNDYKIVSVNKTETKYVILEYSDIKPGTYYYYDSDTGTLAKLTDTAPWLKDELLAHMQPVQYTSRDGYSINGYLTLPKGSKGKNLPVIILPHGGPWIRDYWGFRPEVQFLANRGYAVLQMNFRGSTGYGKAFVNAGNKEWGRKMQNDITDGAKWLIAQGIADPKRIGIFGASYGGYAVLAGLTFTPELYACGIDLSGPSNLFTFIANVPSYWKPTIGQFYEQIGHPEKDAELLREASPIFHVDKIRAPLFVAQGARDPRVKINESEQLVSAMRDRGIPLEYMVKSDEGHGFLKEENRLDFYQAMEQFLNKYLKPAI